MHAILLKVLLVCVIILLPFSGASGTELKSRFTTVVYENEEQLRRFNKEIYLGSLSYLLRNKKSITVGEEVKNKLDILVERVESILEMFPQEVRFTVMLLSSDKDVRRIYRAKFGKDVKYIAFYSPKDRTIFVSVRDVDTGILAHEIAHVIIDLYYGISTPTKIHEVLAQYVEKHLMD